MSQSKHHPKFSPSKLDALAACPCFENDGETSGAAQSGTDQHTVAACLLKGQPIPPVVLDDGDMDNVLWYVDYVKVHASGELQVEISCNLTDENFQTVTYGTIDAAAGAEIFDYKSDRQKGDHAYQMAAYALMWMQRMGLPAVKAHLCYGRLRQVDIMEFDVAQASQMVLDVTHNQIFEATPCQFCGWCKQKLTCPKQIGKVEEVVAACEPTETGLVIREPTDITDPSTISRMLVMARIVAKWTDAVEAHAKKMAVDNGIELPGFTVKHTSGGVSIGDMNQAFALSGLSAEQFIKACDVKMTKLIKVWKEVNEVSEAVAKKKLNQLLEPVLTENTKRTMLVRVKG
jgi:hypothetical protein